MLNSLLFYRFLLLNSLILVGIGAIHQQGWLVAFVENDKSHISLAIIAVFIIAWVYEGIKSWTISKRINAFKYAVKNDLLSNFNNYSILSVEKLIVIRDKDLTKVNWMTKTAAWLVVLGLLGTVVGFIIALSGIPESGLSGEEGVEGIQNSVGLIISGMHVALYTTLAGGVAGLILEINAAIIHTALYNHWADIIIKLGNKKELG